MDILFVSPDSSRETYQALASRYAAIEPPVWAVLLASALKGEYEVGILDPLAEKLTDHQAWLRIANDRPKLIVFVVYGQNPNSGTTNMAGAVRLARYIHLVERIPIAFVGSHPSALPDETLALDCVDYVLPGDGLEALRAIMQGAKPGVIWSKLSNFKEYDWDLLPTLDHYRAHIWHSNFDESKRSPFAAIYTSLGCAFKCDFCMINMVNRTSADQLDASQSSGMRYLDVVDTLHTLEDLQERGVRNVRLSDEMFFLNRQHYLPIVRGISAWSLDLNLWAYARVDTVRPEYLQDFKAAGINWLCLGIESANQSIRREISKGSYETVDVRQVVCEIKAAGINVLANFIFGLPDEDEAAMRETLDLALELKAEHTNFYPCMALPGTPLYRGAVAAGIELPLDFSGYSFHSYDCLPLPTKHMSAAEVLAFRDKAWETVALNEDYLSMIDHKFGTANTIMEQALIKLKRKIIEPGRVAA